jgi:hypothetical protein
MAFGGEISGMCLRGLIAVGATIIIGNAFSSAALAADRDMTAIAPLERVNPFFLDKANGIGPRFRFFTAPQGLTVACALSIGVHVNDADFVDYPGSEPSTAEVFRVRAARGTQLDPADARRAPVHTEFVLGGDGPISGAMCANLKADPEARGFCSGTISGSDYTIIYSLDPVACGYDNVAVGRALSMHLSIGGRVDQESKPDCASRLKGFIIDIDDLLARNPRDITDVFAVLNRHFPLRGCTLDEVSGIVKTSKYFQGESMNGSKMHVFSISSATASSRGVAVSFGMSDTGESHLPFASWWPPYP